MKLLLIIGYPLSSNFCFLTVVMVAKLKRFCISYAGVLY